MTSRIYADFNATAPLLPLVRDEVTDMLAHFGNASSVHTEGRAMKARLKRARSQIACLVGCETEQVIFTSSGTEANVTALSPLIASRQQQGTGTQSQLFISAIEHASVLNGGRFAPDSVHIIPVDNMGLVSGKILHDMLEEQGYKQDTNVSGSFMVSVMMANNETGVLQDIQTLGDIVHTFGGLFHVDGVQAAGKIEIDFAGLPVDFLSVSAHKIGALPGVGVLIAKEPDRLLNDVLMKGGGQEKNRRGGTENSIGVVSFGLAAEVCQRSLADNAQRLQGLQDRLESGLMQLDDRVNIVSKDVARLPNTTCFVTEGMRAENLVMAFDLAGISVSSGSACSSGKVAVSHVLQAMGYEQGLCESAIRISLGWSSHEEDVTAILAAFKTILERHNKRSAAA